MKLRLNILDRVVAFVFVATFGAFYLFAAFNRPEWVDNISYGLPAANLVERGVLAIPQLGTQFHFNRYWLFNAPLFALGPVPFFLVMGVGRVAYVIHIFVLAVFTLLVIPPLVRKALGFESLAAPTFLSYAILGHRGVFEEIYNQRDSVAAFGAMALAFVPAGGKWSRFPPWWQCLAAGSLPLIHPSLIPACLLWLVWLPWRRTRPAAEGETPRPGSWLIGAALLVISFGCAAAWYGRDEALRSQFLPHLRYGNYRNDARFIGSLRVFASPLVALPSQALNGVMIGLALATLACSVRPDLRRRLAPVLPAALAVAAVLAFDVLRGFSYLRFYLLGLGPCLLWAVRETRAPRTLAVAALGLLAAGNLAISFKFDTRRPTFVDQAEAMRFLVDHTGPSDRIALGPPFVFAAAPRRLPGGRVIVRVVPEPFLLDRRRGAKRFDEAGFRRETRGQTNTYVGDVTWFYHCFMRSEITVRDKPGAEGEPLFPGAEVTEYEFDGRTVIVARARPG